MKEYGKTLVTNKPVESTELLKQLCSSYTPKRTRDNAMVVRNCTISRFDSPGANVNAN